MQSCNLYFTILEVHHDYQNFIYAHPKGSLQPQEGYLLITGRSYFSLIFQWVADAELQTRNKQSSLQTPDMQVMYLSELFQDLTISNSISPFHVCSSPHEADSFTPFQSSHITLHAIITPSSDKLLRPKPELGFHNNTALEIPLSVTFLQNKHFKTK